MREKVGKSRNTVFFQWFVAQEGRKVGSLKRRVRSQLARWEMKSCTPLWREAHLQVKMYKNTSAPDTFGSWDVKKVHAVVARSTFPSQNAQNTSASDHFWKLRCQKKCTPLWREAHFQVKMHKTPQRRTTFGSCDVEKVQRRCGTKHILKSKVLKTGGLGPLLEVEMSKKVHAVVARSTFPSQNVQNTRGSDHFWKFRCAEHTSKSHYSTVQYTPVHSTTLHYTTPHYMTLNDTATQIDS